MSSILEEASHFVSNLLRSATRSEVCFHRLKHTLSVVEAVKIIGKRECLAEDQMEILLLAAWFHDTGYTQTYEGHEAVSKDIAKVFLTKRGYPEHALEKVLECITATKMPQKPLNLLQEILCDADLYHLSQQDYWKKNQLLKKELVQYFKRKYRDDQWYFQNMNFLSNHTYFTKYGREVLELKKKQHLQENVKKLEEIYLHDKS